MTQNTNLIKNSLSAWPAGFKYILNNKWTQKYIAVAIFLNLVVFVSLIFISGLLSVFISKTLQPSLLNTTDGFILVIMSLLLWIILVFLILQTFSSITTIVNAPVYSILTTKIIEKEFPQIQLANSNFVGDIFKALFFELKKLTLSVAITIALVFMNVLPIIGFILYLIITTLQLIFFTGLDALDPFHSLKKYSFRKRLKEIFDNKYQYWPFLFISGILGNIPFLNIFLIPISVVGASLLIKDSGHVE